MTVNMGNTQFLQVVLLLNIDVKLKILCKPFGRHPFTHAKLGGCLRGAAMRRTLSAKTKFRSFPVYYRNDTSKSFLVGGGVSKYTTVFSKVARVNSASTD